MEIFAITLGVLAAAGTGYFLQKRHARELESLSKSSSDSVKSLSGEVSGLRAEMDQISWILRSMSEQVIAADLSGRVLYLNPAAEKVFGVQASESVGKSFLEVIRQAAINGMLTEVLDRGEEIRQEIRLFLPEEIIFEAKALPIRSEGKNRGVLLVLHDISRIKQLEEVRKDFVANVSHELRTPLTSIQGYAETLLDGALTDEKHAREFLTTIHDQAERLSRLVNDLLDLSAIESGKKSPKIAPFSLADLAREVADSLSPQACKHQVRIESRVGPDLPDLNADRDQIKQVLINLAANGIKFNKENGSVAIEAGLKGGNFEITVKDTGVGIPETDLTRVFERFYRVDKARSREEGGTGLGLAIAKHIVEAHGGGVKAESVLDEGTSIIVTLPS